MILYHGTNSKHEGRIREHGLCPRGLKDSNWTIESRNDAVYLTDCYPCYFAMNACDGGEPWLIVEIDTDRLDASNMLPDEDFLEQASRGAVGLPRNMEDRTRWFRERLEEFQDAWELSVEKLGTCCHKGVIPPQAITRIVSFNWRENPEIAWRAMDPTISIINRQLVGESYKALTAAVMDGTDFVPVPFGV